VTAEFLCSTCGKLHEGLATDTGYTLPDVVWAIPEGERAEKAKFNADLCLLGERHFIRCVLDIPFTETKGQFGWGAWAEVDRPTFERYLELYDADGTGEPMKDGLLANDLPPYANSVGSPVAIQFRDPSQRPALFLLPTDNSLLAKEQRNGIDDQRWHEMLAMS
jgi:hypothetical protein